MQADKSLVSPQAFPLCSQALGYKHGPFVLIDAVPTQCCFADSRVNDDRLWAQRHVGSSLATFG